MSKPKSLGPLMICTDCGHQTLKRPEPHQCKTGWADESLSFRPATAAEVAATHKAVTFDGDKAVVIHDAPAAMPVATMAPADGWANVRRLADFAGKFERCKLACQVMAGLQLIELRQTHGVKPGRRTDLATSPSNLERLNWDDLVRKEAGITDETARHWMKMAEGAKPRIKKLLGGDRSKLAGIIEMPVSQWTPDQATQLAELVHKITDGKTQLEFMFEIGVAKKPQGSGATGGARGGNRNKNLSPEEALAAARQLAMQDWLHIEKLVLASYQTKFTVLEDIQVEAQIAALEKALQARRKWLAAPKQTRDAGAMETFFLQPQTT